MSALAGIWYYDGKPVEDEQLIRLAEASRPDGPDGSTTVRPMPGLALQTSHLRFDRLSANERQPFPFGRGSFISWDGRLDNREDLLLVLHHDLDQDISDPALVAAAYARWDTDCLKRLVGDWSLVVWDAHRRSLVLARDYAATRPLYYLDIPGGFAWASCMDALACCFDLRPDDAFVEGKLAHGVPPEITPFEGVRRVSGGHWLSATGVNRPTLHRYWTFEPATLRYRDQQTYTDQFRSLLQEGVQKRLRANRTVWADLSGGWDSSSVVCLATALIQRGQVEAPALQPVSGVFRLSPEADDSQFVRVVERWCGVNSIWRDWDRLDVQFSQLAGIRWPFPNLRTRVLYEPLRESGDRVVLTGRLGDFAMMQSEFHRVSVLEPLYEGHPLRWLRVAFELSRHTRNPLWKALVYPVLRAHFNGRGVETVVAKDREKKVNRFAGAPSVHNPRGVTADVFARARERANASKPYPLPSLAGFLRVKRPFVKRLYSMGHEDSFFSYTPGVIQTSAFLHRPLIEFVVATPQLALWSPAFPRFGMKQALRGILPPEILARPAKHSERTAGVRDERQWAADLIDLEAAAANTAQSWELVRRGYVEPAALAYVLEILRTQDDPPHFFRKWFFLEAWLRTLRAVANRSPAKRIATDREVVHEIPHRLDTPVQARS